MVKWQLPATAWTLGLSGLAVAQDWSAGALKDTRTPLSSNVVPGRYIVQLTPGTAAKRGLQGRDADVLVGQIESDLGYGARVRHDYTAVSGRFHAISIDVDHSTRQATAFSSTSSSSSTSAATSDEDVLADLKTLPGVAAVWPVTTVSLNHTAVNFGAAAADAAAGSRWNPHAATHVDELHARGITGAGQTVCVLDTGADTDHPALAGKIVGGTNMIAGEDASDIEDCAGHGTFVSSVIVADTADELGVAPGANVYMYKVFPGCEQSTSSDTIIAGLLAADADGCDIVSMSLGSAVSYSGSPESMVAAQVAAERLVVIAAGNDGAAGLYYASSPAAGKGVVAVASVESAQTLAWPATIVSSSGETLDIAYVTATGQSLNETVSVPLDFDAGSSCAPLNTDGTSDKAVVLQRGICNEELFQFRASIASGYGYYLLYDSYDQGVSYMTLSGSSDVVKLFAVTAASVGPWTYDQITAGNTLTLNIVAGADDVSFNSTLAGAGQVSYYTSWGPTFENDFYPAVAAPGGNVYGAVIGGGYNIESGTSFSTPYVAGLAALYFEATGSKDFGAFKSRLYASASLLAAYNEADGVSGSVVDSIAPLAQQGAGIVNAVKLVDYTTHITSDVLLALNDTDNRVATRTVTLVNTGPDTVVYTVQHQPAPGVDTRNQYWYPEPYYPPLLSSEQGGTGSVSASPATVTLGPGASADVQVTFTAPVDADVASGVLWSGKVTFVGDNDEAVSVAYSGIEASTYNWTPFPAQPPVFFYDSSTGILYPVNWQNWLYTPDTGNSPEIYFALRYGTHEYSFDLVGPDFTTDQFTYPPQDSASVGRDAWYGPIQQFPMVFPVRFSSVSYVKFQSFGNGTQVPSGQYRILSRALRMFGNPAVPADWQLYLSDTFWVQLGTTLPPGYNESVATLSSVPASALSTLSVPPTSLSQPGFTLSGAPTSVASSAAASTASSSGAFSTSLAASSSAPTSSATVSLPDRTVRLTPTGSPPAAPVDAFTNFGFTVRNAADGTVTTSTTIVDPGAFLHLHIQMAIAAALPTNNTQLSFMLPPEITSVVTTTSMVDSSFLPVGSSSFDDATGLYTLTIGAWGTTHTNITADFYLSCMIRSDYIPAMEAGTYIVEVAAPNGKTFESTLTYPPVDRSAIYKHVVPQVVSAFPQNVTEYVLYVEVPAALVLGQPPQPWALLEFTTAQTSSDGFDCDGVRVLLASKANNDLNDANQIILASAQDVTASPDTAIDCALRGLIIRYNATSASMADGDVLSFVVPGMNGNALISNINFPYQLTAESLADTADAADTADTADTTDTIGTTEVVADALAEVMTEVIAYETVTYYWRAAATPNTFFRGVTVTAPAPTGSGVPTLPAPAAVMPTWACHRWEREL
ncbi:hypothetical protein SCUCBS95973_002889 [Sporothrix curviconia]|uniref:Uncharacterized protein n=1 Tax=Sporothrix curviconia TaxID=1260050 RepID=A0ABP0BAQ7_9PEZI